MVAHTFNLNPGEAEAGDSEFQASLLWETTRIMLIEEILFK